MPIRFVIMRLPLVSLLCLLCICMESCSDDHEDYPPIVSDLLLVRTDALGRCQAAVLDDGSTYPLVSQSLWTDNRDTLVRCQASYTIESGKMELYGLTEVFASRPYPADFILQLSDGILPRDPMKVVSMWKSGGYINMHLSLMTAGLKGHTYAFCEDSTGCYSLLHSRPSGDAEAYAKSVFFSMPIQHEAESVTFSVHTYDGIFTRTFSE